MKIKKIECIMCISCGKKMRDRDIDKTRTEYKTNPVCQKCSDELYVALNGY